MKKTILGILILALVGGAGFYLYLNFNKSNVAIENVLPQGAVFYIELSDVEKNINKISSTELWQNLKKVNYDRLLDGSQMTKEQKMMLDNFKEQLMAPETKMAYEKFFSRDVVLAVYPSTLDYAQLSASDKQNPQIIMDKMLGNIMVATRVNKDVQTAEFVSRFFSKYGSDITVRKSEYKKQTIQFVPLQQGLEIGFVRIKDLIVLGVGENSAKQAIDVFLKEAQPIATDQSFKKIRENGLKQPGMFGFWNMEMFFNSIAKQMNSMMENNQGAGEEYQKQAEDFKRNISGFKSIAFSSQIDELTKLKIDFHFNVEEMQNTALAKVYFNCRSVDNATIKFVPKDVIAYQWNTCFDLDYYWHEVKNEMEKFSDQTKSMEQISAMEQSLGLSIEGDILPAFGNEFGGYISDIQANGLFPLPKLALFIKVDDKDKAEYVLSKINQIPFMALQEDNYSGSIMKYVPMAVGDVQPGYTFLNGYLLIAINRNMLKSSIDVLRGNGMSLVENESFKEVNMGLTDKNMTVQFLKVDQFFSKLEGVVEWGNDWIGSKNQNQSAFVEGAEKRLADTQNEISSLKEEIAGLKKGILSLEDEIWNLESMNMDTAVKKAELAALKNDISYKEGEISAYQEQIPELEKTVVGYKSRQDNPQDRRIIIDEVIYPLFKGLKSIKALGSRTTAQKGMFESTTYIKL